MVGAELGTPLQSPQDTEKIQTASLHPQLNYQLLVTLDFNCLAAKCFGMVIYLLYNPDGSKARCALPAPPISFGFSQGVFWSKIHILRLSVSERPSASAEYQSADNLHPGHTVAS